MAEDRAGEVRRSLPGHSPSAPCASRPRDAGCGMRDAAPAPRALLPPATLSTCPFPAPGGLELPERGKARVKVYEAEHCLAQNCSHLRGALPSQDRDSSRAPSRPSEPGIGEELVGKRNSVQRSFKPRKQRVLQDCTTILVKHRIQKSIAKTAGKTLHFSAARTVKILIRTKLMNSPFCPLIKSSQTTDRLHCPK